jgi:type II secretory pathway pseudopilin PulG
VSPRRIDSEPRVRAACGDPARACTAAAPRAPGPAPRGFALVEMIVAVVLMMAVVATLFLTFFHARNELGRIGNLVNSRQDARAAIQLIERDVRMSGSGWGKMAINISRSGTADSLFAINPGPGGGQNDSVRIIGAWSTSTTSSASMLLGSSTLTVTNVSGFAVNDLIVITNSLLNKAHLFQVTGITGNQLTHATTSSWNVLPGSWGWPPSGSPAGSAVYKIDILSYSVDSTNFRRPALVRRSYNGSPNVVSYNVNKFQVWYRMQDTTLTRTPTVYGTGVALVDKVRPVVFTSLSDPTHPTFNDSVWTEVRPRTF